MTPQETLEYWRKNSNCDEQVKRQLCEEYANAETEVEIIFLDIIYDLIYAEKNQS